jgi:hypothetical protein
LTTPAKSIKKAIKISLYFLAAILLLPLLIYTLFLLPAVQTSAARKATEWLFAEYGVKGHIGKLHIKPFSSLVLEELYLPDTQGDTLFYIGQLEVRIGALDFADTRFGIDFIKLEKARWFMRHYRGAPNANMQFIFDRFSSDTPDTTTSQGLFALNSADIEIYDLHYIWHDENDTSVVNAINWSDLDVRKLNVCIQNFELVGDTIRADIKRLQCTDKSGFDLRDLRGKFELNPITISLSDMDISTANSHLAGYFLMQHNHYEDFEDFLRKVRMESMLYQSHVDARDIAFFTDELGGWQQQLDISVHFAGTVENFALRNLELKHGRHTILRGKARVRGLPEIENTFFNLDFSELTTSAADLGLVQLPPFDGNAYLEMPELIQQFGITTIKGDFVGTYFDFVANARIKSALGNARTDVQLQRNDAGKYSYSGRIGTQNFKLGKLLNEPTLHSVSINTDISGKGFTLDELDAQLDGQIAALHYMDYVYKDIDLSGHLAKREFEGNFSIADTNISLRFEGLILLAEQNPRLRFGVEIDSIKPAVLGFLPRDSSATLYGYIETDLENLHPDSITGNARLSGIRYRESGQMYDPGDIFFRASFENNIRQLEFSGPYLSAIIKGDFTANGLVEGLQTMLHRAMPTAIALPVGTAATETFSWYIHLEKTEELFGIFLPDVETRAPVSLRGIYEGRQQKMGLQLHADTTLLYGFELADINVNIQMGDSAFSGNIASRNIKMSSTGHLENIRFDINGQKDTSQLIFSFRNDTDTSEYSAHVALNMQSTAPLAFDIQFDTVSRVVLNDTAWAFNPNHKILYDTAFTVFDNVQLTDGKKYLSLNGRISKAPKDRMGISFTNFNLANISKLFPQENLRLGGNISGFLNFGSLQTAPQLDADLSLEGLYLNEERLGSGRLKTSWEPEKQEFSVNMDMHSVGNASAVGGKIFYVDGTVRPMNKDSVFDLKLRTEGLKLAVAEPFISEYVNNIKGQLIGHLQLTGNFERPKMSGNMRLDSVGFRVKYLNTSFHMHDQKLRIEEDFIGFDQLTVYDAEGNRASANITVFHDNFKNINFDVSFDTLYRFLCLNTSEKENPFYYGRAYLSGHMSLSGDVNNTWIEIVGATNEKSNFFLPLYSEEVSENEFIKFVNPTTLDSLREDYNIDFTGINMRINLGIHPGTEATLLFDPVTDDALKVKGSGDLEMNIDPKGNFLMSGLYTIKSGTYKFTAERLLTKTFKLEEGGTIRWNGDPLAAMLDVTAVYRVRAPLGSLFNDPAQTQKVSNDCKMNLNGPLEKPALTFDIDFVNVDEATKGQIKSQMPTQDDIDKQFFNLMLFSRYAPASEGVSSDGLVATSSSDLLAGQINSILSKFDNNILDFGVSEIKSSQVEVELSKSLFNDRVHFESNVGMAGSNQSSENGAAEQPSKNSFVGDFTLEYLIREDGKLRAKVFSRAETRTIEYESSGAQTQGVGLFFREEFNSYGELLRRMMFWQKKKDKAPKPPKNVDAPKP